MSGIPPAVSQRIGIDGSKFKGGNDSSVRIRQILLDFAIRIVDL
jgi:hypothetical protein